MFVLYFLNQIEIELTTLDVTNIKEVGMYTYH
jgi:hypothetical protein